VVAWRTDWRVSEPYRQWQPDARLPQYGIVSYSKNVKVKAWTLVIAPLT